VQNDVGIHTSRYSQHTLLMALDIARRHGDGMRDALSGQRYSSADTTMERQF